MDVSSPYAGRARGVFARAFLHTAEQRGRNLQEAARWIRAKRSWTPCGERTSQGPVLDKAPARPDSPGRQQSATWRPVSVHALSKPA